MLQFVTVIAVTLLHSVAFVHVALLLLCSMNMLHCIMKMLHCTLTLLPLFICRLAYSFGLYCIASDHVAQFLLFPVALGHFVSAFVISEARVALAHCLMVL